MFLELPEIPIQRYKFGIKPITAKERFTKDFTIYGFDTETLPFDYTQLSIAYKDKNDKIKVILPKELRYTDIFSIQLVTKSSNNFYFANFKAGKEWLYRLFDKRSLIFAFNLSFDLGALLGEDYKLFLEKNTEICLDIDKDIWLKGRIIDGLVNFAQFDFFTYKNNEKIILKTLHFIDCANFFSMNMKLPLDLIAKTNFPDNPEFFKFKKPDYLGKRLPTKEEEKDFIDYAVQDANICYQLGLKILNLHKQYNLKICKTFPTFFSHILRKQFFTKPLLLPNPEQINFIWQTYAGGKFEAYGKGYFKNTYLLDVNSLYPFAATFPLPFEHTNYTTIFDFDNFKNNKDLIGFIQCHFKFPEKTIYPSLPVRTYKMFFPLEGDTICTSYELREALKQNVEISDFEGLCFFPSEYEKEHPLKQFVEFFYAEKKKFDEIINERELTQLEKNNRNFFKLGLNSCYGKFAERHKNYKGELKAGKMFHPAIASLITGKARSELNKIINKYKSLYSDTDSCITTLKPDKKDLGTELGKLKIEMIGDTIIIRPKLYRIWNDNNEKIAFHSFRNKNTFRDLVKNSTSIKKFSYSHLKMTKIKESMTRKLIPRSWLIQNFSVDFRDDDKRNYHKKLLTLDKICLDNTLSSPLKFAPEKIK